MAVKKKICVTPVELMQNRVSFELNAGLHSLERWLPGYC